MAETILEMKDITKRFPGVVALDRVNLTLHRGEILALIGENGAGKSTLMNCLVGIYQKDEGEVIYHGSKVEFKGPADALNAGISMIHQELNLVQTFTVAENIWLGRTKQFRKGGLVNQVAMIEATQELFNRLNIHIDPAALVSTLSVANMQLVELARAVSYNSDVIIMDEPTSALADTEIELLFQIIKDLAAQGIGIIFISHKLEELYVICDNMTVMRNGTYITTKACSDISMDELISLIAGRELGSIYTKDTDIEKGDVILKVEHLNGEAFHDVSFELRTGEVLGFCGLMGAGRSEIMRGIFGIDEVYSGKIYVNGQEVIIRNPRDAIDMGISMVTEDRLRQGILQSMPISTNITLPNIKNYAKWVFMNSSQEIKDCEKMEKELSIKKASFSDPVDSLSGGNQQKVILARWLLMEPQILILDEPTRGIDVGTKSEIYKIINGLAKSGKAIIMVSSEMPEILGMCDRIAVVRGGTIVHEESNRPDLEADALLTHAFGV